MPNHEGRTLKSYQFEPSRLAGNSLDVPLHTQFGYSTYDLNKKVCGVLALVSFLKLSGAGNAFK